ncbi:hypothetical protein E1B28_011837 [Marasmius oreades]|uniref:G domain-containing protein n=1 Tax=Marasmius oreades TaxID=181124 RepID=A0A9P7RV42_9AGAR|nr:uncharacterized protein E1B28_011837 [Marasmius oreades]KAG7090237.1 hypothetical protein E1B28_011837 [Marasmius oreades]
MGVTGSGKSTFINKASGYDGMLRVGNGLESCTSAIQLSPGFELGGRQVTLVDTPGFDDTTKGDASALNTIAMFLGELYRQKQKLAGLVYLHRISDVRMGASSTRSFRIFEKLCGEAAFGNVMIVTTNWGQVPLEVGEAREAELRRNEAFFKPMLDNGAQLVRYDLTPETARAILLPLVWRAEPRPLRIQIELAVERKGIEETAAGAEIGRELLVLMVKHEGTIRGLRREKEEALRTQDEQARIEVEAEIEKLRTEVLRARTHALTMSRDFALKNEDLKRRVNKATMTECDPEVAVNLQTSRKLPKDEERKSAQRTRRGLAAGSILSVIVAALKLGSTVILSVLVNEDVNTDVENPHFLQDIF